MSVTALSKVNVYLEANHHINKFWFLQNYEKKHMLRHFLDTRYLILL